jgi:hypothetical protein
MVAEDILRQRPVDHLQKVIVYFVEAACKMANLAFCFTAK